MKPINYKPKHWWRRLSLLLACLLGGSSGAWAYSWTYFPEHCYIAEHPTPHHPYITLEMIYYDWTTHSNAYFMKNKQWVPKDGGDYLDVYGPSVWVDGNYICCPAYELAWPGGDNAGNGNGAADAADDYNEWFGDGYSKTVGGITYTVRFWNPYRSCNQTNHKKFSVRMCVYISKMEIGSTHTVRIKGTWRHLDGCGSTACAVDYDVDNTWTTNAIDCPWTAPTATMIDYQTLSLSGPLNSDYGDTKVGFYEEKHSSIPGGFYDEGDLKSVQSYTKGSTSFSDQECKHTRTDAQQASGSNTAVEYMMKLKPDGYDVVLYKWYDVNVPGFAKPTSITLEPNQWKKWVWVRWTKDESNRSTAGTWAVYRDGELIAKDIDNNGRLEYTDNDETSGPEYDTNYDYKVAFVPKNATSAFESLSLTEDVVLEREWSITGFTGKLIGDDQIELTWNHNAIDDATSSKTYQLSLYRMNESDDNPVWGNAIQTFSINSSSVKDGSFTDTSSNGLNGNQTYRYKLSIELLGKQFEATIDGIRTGGSKLIDFTASRGTYDDMVKLAWTAKQSGTNETSYILYRRPLGSNDDRDWVQIYTTSGTGSNYSYDDNTVLIGTFNEYKVAIVGMEKNNLQTYSYLTTDGFIMATGVISGRVTYGTGTAVDGVRVALKQQDGDGQHSEAGMHSLRLREDGAGMSYQTDTTEIQNLFKEDFSVQMWLKPLKDEMGADGCDYLAFDVVNVFTIRLWYDQQRNAYQVGGWMTGNEKTPFYIPADEWSQLSFSHSHDNKCTYVFVATPDSIMSDTILVGKQVVWEGEALKSNDVAIGNSGEFNSHNIRGYIDEVRFFTKALTDKEVRRNYNHPLAGNEEGLAIYYPFDEGLESQTIAYDYSKTNGIANGRHAITKVAAYSSTNVPSEKQLSMMTYTDSLGNYTIRGVYFTGEGTSYSVIPELGIHEFSPARQSRFVSQSSLVHSGVDFEDVSSFPVSGKILYSGTDYPVEGVNFYVDGTVCSKDGEVIQTDDEGKFTISVPIGEHFIQVKKNGHDFVDNGRYPADPNGTGQKVTFKQEIKNLEFRDTTLVNFSGRVVGGDLEGEKVVGFAQSVNNIGITELVLKATNNKYRLNVKKVKKNTTVSYENQESNTPVESATASIKSTAWRSGGTTKAECQSIVIHTDSLTGEFSALVPPLFYNITGIKVVATGQKVGDATSVDLSNPLLMYNDSLKADDGSMDYYQYNKLFRHTYHSEPSFSIVQSDNEVGAFGIDKYTVTDEEGSFDVDSIYYVTDEGEVAYRFNDAALFIMDDPYVFFMEGFEEYKNYDADKNNPLISKVPMAGAVVNIDNALSSSQAVYIEGNDDGAEPGSVYQLKSNQLELDSLGQATYQWKAGFPNISSPYTRTISVAYKIGGRTYHWNDGTPITGVVLGSLPTGNNFVTAGPDLLDMVLRDPPGTHSSTQWTKGTVHSVSHTDGSVWSSNTHVKTTSKLGVDLKVVKGIGVAEVTEVKSRLDVNVGTEVSETGENSTSWSRSVKTTQSISTSDSPDFVGAKGDVFIGSSTNIIFGLARNVDLKRVGKKKEAELTLDDAVTTGLSFETEFAYTQGYIEDVLIPNLRAMRNSKLRTVSSLNGHENTEQYPIYLTTLTEDDPKFGSSNHDKSVWNDEATAGPSSDGPSYKMITPKNSNESWQDSVEWCNNQISIWKKHLAFNEREKVRAYMLRENNDSVTFHTNYSFDAGSRITYTNEVDSVSSTRHDVTVTGIAIIGGVTGVAINSTGVILDIGTETGGGTHEVDETSDEESVSFSFTLAEEGNDAITTDVYRYGAFGPIFRTRGGQTSNPYEGREVTKYYEPGTTIMEPTMQIEVPTIAVDVPIVSDIPSGSAAGYTLRLGNASEISEDVTYRLFMLDGTNPNGAQLTIDGKVLAEGRLIKVPATQTLTKALQLRQTDTSILDYEDIGIVFASDCQPSVIADTVFISAHFVPSSSDVELALSNTTMNTLTGTDLTLDFSGFDLNYKNLKAFRLQYKKQGSTDWTLIMEYVLDEKDKTENNEMMPASGALVSYTLPMASFSDGNYLFRCVSASTYGTGEVYKYSDEITLVKDMMRPRPLGQPEPTDGILDIGDELSVTFNETFLRGELTQEANFTVTGVLNGAKVDHQTALSMQDIETTAQTEADINLAAKDFAADMWVNISGKGTILSHGNGTNKLNISTDNDGKLLLEIGGEAYTSLEAIPQNKWVFLSLSYHYNTSGGLVNASVASDDEQKTLFQDYPVAAYKGNGPLTVGKSIDGAIHELLLWDEVHDMTTALLNRSKTKNPSTRHLIGYWKMNEGEGKTIRDYARNRHMTMTDETWYLNNVNMAVSLDGQSHLMFPAADSPYCTEDDYAIEMWVRADKQQGSASLIQAGKVSLWLNDEGLLILSNANDEDSDEGSVGQSNASTSDYDVGSQPLTDNAWHHIALNVLRQGTAAVYVDGERKFTTSSNNVGDIATNYIIIGARRNSPDLQQYSYDRYFKGQVDEIRVWDATLNSTQLSQNRKIRLTGKEHGLAYYYPFETKQLDENNQVITTGIPANLTERGADAELWNNDGTKADFSYSEMAPALREKPTETNVSYTFVASDNKIVIDIDEDPSTVEGCTLNFNVRDVCDVNGNYSEPVVWSAFVNRNELAWETPTLYINHQAGNRTTFSATILNRGGKQQLWTLSGMPAWLTTDNTEGNTSPLGTTDITFTINEYAPIGKYEETVYLMGNNGIETPLMLNIHVSGETPLWSVNPSDYDDSMSLIATLIFPEGPSNDSDDILAAFIDNECRGVAKPTYSQRYDRYLLFMNIYGHIEDTGKDISFKAYNAATGITYAVVEPSVQITYKPGSVLGKNAEPVVFTALDCLEQEQTLGKGWNWMSLYVTTDDMTVPALFADLTADAHIVKSQECFMASDGIRWKGSSLLVLNNHDMFMVNMHKESSFKVAGKQVDPANEKINIMPQWNWMAYNGARIISVADAMAGLEALDGDIIKSQYHFAIYDGYEWNGTLNTLAPGEGYKYYSNAAEDKSFTYPQAAVSGPHMTMPRHTATHGDFKPIDPRSYPGNMTVIAQIIVNGEVKPEIEVAVFDDTQCRAAEVTDEEGIAFFTIPGEDNSPLFFKVIGDEGKLFQANEQLNYVNDGIIGTLGQPYTIHFYFCDEATWMGTAQYDVHVWPQRVQNSVHVDSDIDIKQILILDTAGQLVMSIDGGLSHENTLNLSGCADGIYFVKVVLNSGQPVVRRIIKG